MSTFWVDPNKGDDDNSGLKESDPMKSFKNFKNIHIDFGDQVLVKTESGWIDGTMEANKGMGVDII